MDKITRTNYGKKQNGVKRALKLGGISILCLLFFLAGYVISMMFN